MSEIRIASRYAKSLIELAIEQDKLEAVTADMLLFAETCEASKELTTLLKSPVVPGYKKLKVLDAVFKGFNELTRLFMHTVVKKGREAFLPLIAKESISLYNERNNIAHASVITAVALDAKTLGDIQKMLEEKTGKKISLESKVDPGIIGGMVIRMGDSLYDASIAGKLKKIKKELVLN